MRPTRLRFTQANPYGPAHEWIMTAKKGTCGQADCNSWGLLQSSRSPRQRGQKQPWPCGCIFFLDPQMVVVLSVSLENQATDHSPKRQTHPQASPGCRWNADCLPRGGMNHPILSCAQAASESTQEHVVLNRPCSFGFMNIWLWVRKRYETMD